jgi:hypothetical protein
LEIGPPSHERGLAGAGDDQDAGRVVHGQVVEGAVDLPYGRQIERVLDRRPVDRQGGDGLRDVDADVLKGHDQYS